MPRKSAHTEDNFDGFANVELMGSGSFADVYRALDISTNQNVALKVLHATVKELGSDSTFEMETRALGTLSAHPNIVTLYRTSVLRSGRPMLVLELCGGSLADQLNSTGPIHPSLVVKIGIQIAGALESAHRSGILHRDIKPQNILVSRYGAALLADFGVAEMKNASGHEYAVSGLSVLHAPPEILWDKDATARSDVYSLASTMYELLCARSPFFITDSENAAAVRLRVLNQPPPVLSVADMPPKLWDILSRALMKEPSQRHASALEFAHDLRALEILHGWPQTECIVDGVSQLDLPDPTRLKTRLTGSVVNAGVLPGLGNLGRNFGDDSSLDSIPTLEPISRSQDSMFTIESSLISTTAVEVVAEADSSSLNKSISDDVQTASVLIQAADVSSEIDHSLHDVGADTRQQVGVTTTNEPMLGIFSPLSDTYDTQEQAEPFIEVEIPRIDEVVAVPTFNLQPINPSATGQSIQRDNTDPIRLSDSSQELPKQDIPVPDNPSAIPGEVLWGYTPRTGLTGTIELSPKDRQTGSQSKDESSSRPKRQRFGRRKDRD
jgi:serine/threonine protein kinase